MQENMDKIQTQNGLLPLKNTIRKLKTKLFCIY